MIRKSRLCRGKPPKRSSKPIPRSNPKRKAKRDRIHAKDRNSPHVKAVIAEAFERAGNRCEFIASMTIQPIPIKVDGEGITTATGTAYMHNRCEATEELEPHHLRYPKTRPLELRDITIRCKYHHRLAEKAKMHKWNRNVW